MHLKAHNQKVLKKLAEGDTAFTRVHFEAPYKKRRAYDITDDSHSFLDYFNRANVIATLKLTGVKLSCNHFLLLALGIHKSQSLEKLVLYKVSRSDFGVFLKLTLYFLKNIMARNIQATSI